jgi:hypothetical protein
MADMWDNRTMRIFVLLMLVGCGDNNNATLPPDMAMPKPILDMTAVGTTTCVKAAGCMQNCNGHFAECYAICDVDLTPAAQTAFDGLASCVNANCGVGDGGGLPLCDQWALPSCVTCSYTYCKPEVDACLAH